MNKSTVSVIKLVKISYFVIILLSQTVVRIISRQPFFFIIRYSFPTYLTFLSNRKTPETQGFWGILRLDTTLSCDNKSIFRLYYSMIVATVPDPTVRPPSRIATRGAQTSAKPFFTLFPVSETASAKILPRTFSTHSSRVRRRTLCAPVLSRSPRRADPPA